MKQIWSVPLLILGGCISPIPPQFDIQVLERTVVADERREVTLVGRISVFGREIGLYPSNINFGKRYEGACVSGRDADMPKKEWDGKWATVTGEIRQFESVVPSFFVSFMDNYCFSKIVILIDRVELLPDRNR